MATERPKLSLLEQREIEARIVGPLIQAVRAELGEEKTLALVRRVIAELARQSGAELAQRLGEASLPAFAQCLDRWSEGGALEIEVLEQSADRLSFNVTRCRYAEMYRALGLADLGSSLSCQRDFSLIEGFNPAIAAHAAPRPSWKGRRTATSASAPRPTPPSAEPPRPKSGPRVRLKSAGQFSDNNDCMDHDRGSSWDGAAVAPRFAPIRTRPTEGAFAMASGAHGTSRLAYPGTLAMLALALAVSRSP